jgi:hypothetical protein
VRRTAANMNARCAVLGIALPSILARVREIDGPYTSSESNFPVAVDNVLYTFVENEELRELARREKTTLIDMAEAKIFDYVTRESIMKLRAKTHLII